MSNANEPGQGAGAAAPADGDAEGIAAPGAWAGRDDGPRLRIEVTRGGDPGPEVLAALAAVLARPVRMAAPSEDEPVPARRVQSRWVRAARLEGLRHGRRITTIADLAWRRMS